MNLPTESDRGGLGRITPFRDLLRTGRRQLGEDLRRNNLAAGTFNANQVVPNSLVAGPGAGAAADVFAGAADFIVNVAGYFGDQAVGVNDAGLLF